jgi:hypothetical protein
MWSLFAARCFAVEPVEPEGVYGPWPPPDVSGQLELQVQDEERWARVDRRAAHTADVALVVSGVGIGVSTAGLLLVGAGDFGDEAATVPGALMVGAGAVTTTAATPVFLAALGRSHRSLKERNVRTGAGSGALAWTLFGSALPLSLAFVEAPVTYPIWAGSVLALGCAQAAHDDRARRGAALPATGVPWRVGLVPRVDGMSLAGTF